MINAWMKECPAHLLKELEIAVPCEGHTRTFFSEVEADFDVFTDDLSADTQNRLASLVTEKILPENYADAWHKVFVKDDCGCNAVGMCVLGTEHLKDSTFDPHRHSSSSRESTSSRDDAERSQKIVLTREHRMALRVRKQRSRVSCGEEVRYVLQEGIPTGLIHSKTGAQLEIVLMCADGQAYTYFVREAPVSKHVRNGDNCESLNVPGVRFVSRSDFESLPEYEDEDAFAQVRKRWPRYLLVGTLCAVHVSLGKAEATLVRAT